MTGQFDKNVRAEDERIRLKILIDNQSFVGVSAANGLDCQCQSLNEGKGSLSTAVLHHREIDFKVGISDACGVL